MSLIPTVGWAMVLLTSGIVDERPFVLSPALQYGRVSQLAGACGVEPGGGGWDGLGFDTLLGPEESGPLTTFACMRVGWCGGLVLLCLLCPACSCVSWWGVGGRVLCDLNSGREHLATPDPECWGFDGVV